jgi:hypothetical protein
MTYAALGCKRCKVYINIDTYCGGHGGVATFDFVKRHSHGRDLRYLEENTVGYFQHIGYAEERD